MYSHRIHPFADIWVSALYSRAILVPREERQKGTERGESIIGMDSMEKRKKGRNVAKKAENSEKGTEDRWELEGKKTGTYFEILIPPQQFLPY